MRKSNSFYRRHELLKKFEFPKQAEILEHHGEHLTKVINEYIDTSLKGDLGLIPQLKGAGEDLWTSPSDMLIPNVRLKPPLTTKYIRALTHEGILENGMSIQQQLQNELKSRVIVEMKLLTEKLGFMCKREITKAIEAEKVNNTSRLEAEIKMIKSEYHKHLQKKVKSLKDQMALKYEEMLHKKRIEIEKEMETIYFENIHRFVAEIINEFNEQFELEKKHCADELAEIILIEEEKIRQVLQTAEAEKMEVIGLLQHDLECRNMANIMYILTAERNRAEEEKTHIRNEYKIRIDQLNAKALELHNKIFNLENICETQQTTIEKWEKQMLRICEEFQKFINFALKACPTQAEFLIDLEKFLHENAPSKIDYTSNHLHHRHTSCPKVSRLPTMKDSEEFIKTIQYCPTEPEPDLPDPNSRRTLDSSEDLPQFIYNRHLYVREDFRNKQLQIFSPDPDIWKKEDLKIDSENPLYTADTRVKYPIGTSVKFDFETEGKFFGPKKQLTDVKRVSERTSIVPPSRSLFGKGPIEEPYEMKISSGEMLKKNTQRTRKLDLSRNSIIVYLERLRKNNQLKNQTEIDDNQLSNVKKVHSSKMACVKDSLQIHKERVRKKSFYEEIHDNGVSNEKGNSTQIKDQLSEIQQVHDYVNIPDVEQKTDDSAVDELVSLQDLNQANNQKIHISNSRSSNVKTPNKFIVIGDRTLECDTEDQNNCDRFEGVREIDRINKELLEKSNTYSREYLEKFKNLK